MVRRNSALFFLLAVFTAMGAFAPFPAPIQAQEPPPPETASPEEDPLPVVVPVEALQLGELMQQVAAPKFLKWADRYAKKNFFKDDAPPTAELVNRAVQKRFPKSPERERQTAAFAVWYAGYREAAELQGIIAARLRDRDLQLRDLAQEIRVLESSPRISGQTDWREAPFGERVRMEQRMEEIARQRRFHYRQYQIVREQADLCLWHLNQLFGEVRDVTAADVKRLK